MSQVLDQFEMLVTQQFSQLQGFSAERNLHSKVGTDLKVITPPEGVRDISKVLDEAGFAIDMVTGVDWPEENHIELIYDFFHFDSGLRVAVHTRVGRDEPEVETVSDIFAGANWHERETAEFFGVKFRNHPNLINLLLPDDMEGYPLRKDFNSDPEKE